MKVLKFFFLFLIFSSFTPVEKNVSLKYTFKVGDRYDYIQSTKQTIKQTIPGMGEVLTEVSYDGIMEFSIKELTSTGAKIETQYKKLKVFTKSSMIDINMDSEGPEDDVKNKVIKSMMNKPFSFNLSATGKVEKVEDSDNIFSGLNSLGLDENTLAQMKQSMKQTVSESSLRASLESGLIRYAEDKVGPGDTWTNETELTLAFPLRIQNNWSLEKVEGSTAWVEGEGIITTTDKEKINSLPNGIKSKSDLSGKQVVNGNVNLKTGWPAGITMTSEIKGKMTLQAGGMIPENVEVPMEIVMKSTFTIARK
jgi:hypothetical protein